MAGRAPYAPLHRRVRPNLGRDLRPRCTPWQAARPASWLCRHHACRERTMIRPTTGPGHGRYAGWF